MNTTYISRLYVLVVKALASKYISISFEDATLPEVERMWTRSLSDSDGVILQVTIFLAFNRDVTRADAILEIKILLGLASPSSVALNQHYRAREDCNL